MPIARPLDEFLAEDARGDHEELQEEPIVAKPHEEVRAQDDRKRAAAEYPAIAAKPRDEHVETVGEEQLRRDQRDVSVDLAPVPSPVGINAGLHRRLDVMNRQGTDLVGEPAAGSSELAA